MIYIDSAYPASDSIMETEQRTNQMNNLLRVMSDQQMSCNYGRKPEESSSPLFFWGFSCHYSLPGKDFPL